MEQEKDMRPVALLMLRTSNKFDYLKQYWGICMGTVTQKGNMLPILESFMDNGCNFEFNPFPDGEPMEFNEDRRDMMTSSNS